MIRMSAKRSMVVFFVVVALLLGVSYILFPPPKAPVTPPKIPVTPPKIPGSLPTWSVGDNWVYENTTHSIFTYVVESVGPYAPPSDNTPAYRITGTISPAGTWGDNIVQHYRKADLDLLSDRVYGATTDLNRTFTYSYSAERWPLVVGKSYTVVENITTYRRVGADITSDTTSRTLQVTVENLENITVGGETFECYKIVKRDGTPGPEYGWLVETIYYSDNVKREVKITKHRIAETLELKSYHVS